MDQTTHQNVSTLSRFMQSLSLKNVIIIMSNFLLSACVFSFLFSSSPCLSLFFHSFNYSHFSTLPLHDLFTNTTDRKPIFFLICNGILAFLALVRSKPSASNEDYEIFKGEDDLRLDPTVLGNDVLTFEGEEGMVEENEGCQLDEIDYVETEEFKGGDEGGQSGCREIKEDSNCGFFTEEEEEEEGRNGSLSAEELNRKFDEFIRRMKEGIRIEAQQQLVMVH